jgi:DNA-binding XRE family transcriptional regulator
MFAIMHNASSLHKCLLHHSFDYPAVMSEASDRLRKARERAGYSSAKAAAEAMGVPVATYIQHENGSRGFPAGRAERYGRFFRVAPEWLLYGSKTINAEAVELGPRLYVKGSVAAGVWKEAWEVEPDEWEVFTGRADIAAPTSRRFGLRTVGESMNEIYPPGTILECVAYDNEEPIPSGKRVIAVRTKVDGTVEATVKELVRTDDGVQWLVPRSRNPEFQAFRGDKPDSPDIVSIEIVGIVVASTRPE